MKFLTKVSLPGSLGTAVSALTRIFKDETKAAPHQTPKQSEQERIGGTESDTFIFGGDDHLPKATEPDTVDYNAGNHFLGSPKPDTVDYDAGNPLLGGTGSDTVTIDQNIPRHKILTRKPG